MSKETEDMDSERNEAQQGQEVLARRLREAFWPDGRRLIYNRPSADSTPADREENVETEIAGLRHWAQDFVEFFKCGPARDARVIDRDPLPPAATLSKESRRNLDWVELFIEIAEGPIRWVNLGSEVGYRFGSLYVPDSRIHADFPGVFVTLVAERSFPLVGRVKGFKWGSFVKRGRGISQRVADALNRDPAVMRGISQLVADTLIGDESAMRATLPSDPRDLFYLYVLAGAGYGCWKIAEHREKDEYEDAEPVCSEQLWDFYQAIANCLLQTPMPADEGQTS